MSWRVGSASIEDLLRRGDLSQVPADSRLTERLLGDASRHLESAGRIRRNRNNFEYPDADTAPAHEDDVADAYEVASEALRVATSILHTGQLTPWT